VALTQYSSKEDLDKRLMALREEIEKKYVNPEIQLPISIGVSLYPDDATTMYDLKKKADIAMYQAKAEGKNRYIYFSEIAA